MKLTLKEMNGLLNGKFLPSDLIVGETLAEYLVRKFAEADDRCAALAAENASLKAAVIERKNLSEEIRNAGRPPHSDFWHQSIYMADKKVDDALNCTASTDAFLAEVRAQGVEMFASELGNVHKQLRPRSNHAHAIKSAVFRAVDFAAQLRKGDHS